MPRAILVDTPPAEQSWDSYVLPRAHSITDTPGWRAVVCDTYGVRAHLLGALEGDRWVGALGMYQIKHPIFGHYLTTAAFETDGGLFYESATARAELLRRARALADELDVEYLLVRTRDEPLEGFAVERRYVTAVIDVTGSPETIWKSLPSKTRNQVRKGCGSGVTISFGHEHIDSFFDVFHHHMRDLGSPAHSRGFYENVLRQLHQCTDVIIVSSGDDLVAGALVFYVNRTAMNFHTVSLHRYNPLCANYLLYWTMLRRSNSLGCRAFDMGRSVESSTQIAFKRNWGPDLVPLFYNYYLRKRDDIPFLDPRNPSYAAAIFMWKRLPLRLTKALGPHLIRGLV